MTGGELTLGVIVCCRDEERVIERRLRNLALSRWPESERRHRVLVVDDGSRDRTAKTASEVGASVFPEGVEFELVANDVRPGKSGAIACAIRQLAARVDLLVLTDADVVNDSWALVEIARAFRRDERLGMACGSQTFVQALLPDGTLDPKLMRSTSSGYDRWTAWVRGLESLGGRVFSVHGQLLAWRARLSLEPRSGLAADDLDLMRQARQLGVRVERIQAARFFELKPWSEALRRTQALRRARAYLQFVRDLRTGDLDPWTRLQWGFYKHFPPALPRVALAGCLLLVLAGLAFVWTREPLSPDRRVGASLLWLLLADHFARWLRKKLSVLEEAKRLERVHQLDDRWSTAR